MLSRMMLLLLLQLLLPLLLLLTVGEQVMHRACATPSRAKNPEGP